MGNRLTDGEKVVVSVFVAVLAGCVAGLFFVGGAILDMKDAITDVKVSLVEVQRTSVPHSRTSLTSRKIWTGSGRRFPTVSTGLKRGSRRWRRPSRPTTGACRDPRTDLRLPVRTGSEPTGTLSRSMAGPEPVSTDRTASSSARASSACPAPTSCAARDGRSPSSTGASPATAVRGAPPDCSAPPIPSRCPGRGCWRRRCAGCSGRTARSTSASGSTRPCPDGCSGSPGPAPSPAPARASGPSARCPR